MDITIGAVALIVFVPGVVQVLKKWFGLQDNGAEAFAIALGTVFALLSWAITTEVIQPDIAKWIVAVVGSLSTGMGLAGYYKLLKPGE